MERHQVELTYADREGRTSTRRISPLGLVKKEHTWYLLAGTDSGQRTFRIDRVHGVVRTDTPVAPDADFDLATEWQKVAENVNQMRRTFRAQLCVRREHVTPLRYQFGEDLEVEGELEDGRFEVTEQALKQAGSSQWTEIQDTGSSD